LPALPRGPRYATLIHPSTKVNPNPALARARDADSAPVLFGIINRMDAFHSV
jgi:hypothetical protein